MLINEFLSWRRRWGRVLPRPDVEPARTEPDHAVAIADRDALRQRLRRLPRGQRVVLTLRYFEGLSDTEIAAEMGCSPGTVRGYASRALSALRIDGSDAPDPSREPADRRPPVDGPSRTSTASRGGAQ
jgi:RNA polymerase sigma factor (sigma-70 family)